MVTIVTYYFIDQGLHGGVVLHSEKVVGSNPPSGRGLSVLSLSPRRKGTWATSKLNLCTVSPIVQYNTQHTHTHTTHCDRLPHSRLHTFSLFTRIHRPQPKQEATQHTSTKRPAACYGRRLLVDVRPDTDLMGSLTYDNRNWGLGVGRGENRCWT